MKIFRLTITIIALSIFCSCSGWLDVEPKETITEEQLFATGDGYRNALLGVYRQMATSSMYGCQMKWGALDVMGQLYNTSRFKSYTTYNKMGKQFNYKDKEVKAIFDEIWKKAYNSIANCNNLIARIEKTDSLMFKELGPEKNLIQGEAYALRAYLHFDMLRLFAPAPIADKDGKTYIPYFDTYPSTHEPNRTVKEILSLVEQDLLKAKTLVGSYDTTKYKTMLETPKVRMVSTNGSSDEAKDLFFLFRGYRMNYYAITGVLARVYNYMGTYDAEYYKKAYDQAEEVIKATSVPTSSSSYYRYFQFADSWEAEEDRKLYGEILFCLSREKLAEDYLLYTYNDNGIEFVLRGSKTELFDDPMDTRQLNMTEPKGSYIACNKYKSPVSTSEFEHNKDMLPMIRYSEMYYIQAEYLYRSGQTQEAINLLDKVRDARDCTIGNLKITDQASFNNELIKEARREFMQEGELFYYYKRLNIKPISTMPDAAFVVELPDSEIIN